VQAFQGTAKTASLEFAEMEPPFTLALVVLLCTSFTMLHGSAPCNPGEAKIG